MAASDDDAAGGETAPDWVPAEGPGGKSERKLMFKLCMVCSRAELLWQPQDMCNLL